MAEDISIDQLREELEKWQETRDFLNREIAAVEDSTKNISVWMAENSKAIYQHYHNAFDSLRKGNEAKLEQTLDAMGEFAGTILKMPNAEGQTIITAAAKLFGEDSKVVARMQDVELEFPEDIFIPVVEPEEEDADAKAEAEQKAEEEKPKKKGWWPFGGEAKEKPADVLEQIAEVRGELLGLRTTKPFYVNSFFDWMESMHVPVEGEPEVLGDGDYIDYLTRTYRNPDYLLSQVYNDCNESLQVIFEDLCENAKAYDTLKAAFVDQDLEYLGNTVETYKDNNDIVKQLLEEQNQTSLTSWALDAFDTTKKRTEAFKAVVSVAPETLSLNGVSNDETQIFDQIFFWTLEEEPKLGAKALNAAYKALRQRNDNDNFALELAVIAAETPTAPAEQSAEASVVEEAVTEDQTAESQSQEPEQGQDGQDGQQGADGQDQGGQSGSEMTNMFNNVASPKETLDELNNKDSLDHVDDLYEAKKKAQAEAEAARLKAEAERAKAEAEAQAEQARLQAEADAAREKAETEAQRKQDAAERYARLREDLPHKAFLGRTKLTQAINATEDNPEQTKDVLHALFKIIGKDTDAVDLYVDMRKAMKENKTQRVSSLLQKADRETLEQWLILRDAFEPNCAHVMEDVLATAKTDDGRAKLFKAATAAGIPPIFTTKDQDHQLEMQKAVHARLDAALETGKAADFGIFEGTLNFVVANTSKDVYTEMLTKTFDRQKSLLAKVLDKHPEAEDAQTAYFDAMFASFDKDIEVADAYYVTAQSPVHSSERKTLLALADGKTGAYVQMQNGEQSTVIIPEKTGHLYESYNAAGYFSGIKTGQGETEIPAHNAATFLNVIEARDGFSRVGNDLLRPEAWDMMIYNAQYGDLEAFKNSTDRVSFPMEGNKFDRFMAEAQTQKSDFVAFEDMMLLDATQFTSIRYDKEAGDVIFDQELVISDIKQDAFDTLINAIQAKNNNLLIVEDENLVMNAQKVDGVYKRTMEYYDPDGGEWEEQTFELLVNGRTIFVNDLFGERDYGLDTDIEEQSAKDSELAQKLVEKFEALDAFETITEEVAVNKDAMAGAKLYGDNGQDTIVLTGRNKYSLEMTTDNAEDSAEAQTLWVNAERIMDAPFIEVIDGELQVYMHGEGLAIDAKGLKRQLKASHTEILEDFYCNKDDICEVSVQRGQDPRVILKSTTEDVSIDVNESDIDAVAKKLGLDDTLLTQTQGAKTTSLRDAVVLPFYKKDAKRSVSEALSDLSSAKDRTTYGKKKASPKP